MAGLSMTPIPASKALDAYFLEARSRLLDVAAILDRIDRGSYCDSLDDDPRLELLGLAIEALATTEGGRAEAIQRIFSDEYDPHWAIPKPRDV